VSKPLESQHVAGDVTKRGDLYQGRPSKIAFMKQEIRVLLIDDHALFRESVSRLLLAEPDFSAVRTCGHVEEALSLLQSEVFDVVLLDYNLGGEPGLLFLDGARAGGFKGQILIVTADMRSTTVLRVLERGVSGILLKQASPAELVEAIQKIMTGETWLDWRAVKPLIEGMSRRAEEQRIQPSLTPRERSVLLAVFEGLSNKEIAMKLDLSESAVKAMLHQLFAKTGVRTRGQLVRVTLEKHSEGWLGGNSLE
jgi:two-component system, NarL family, nitrate/nitrite response regulator NarL